MIIIKNDNTYTVALVKFGSFLKIFLFLRIKLVRNSQVPKSIPISLYMRKKHNIISYDHCKFY